MHQTMALQERAGLSELGLSSEEWGALRAAHPNLLLIGSDTEVNRFLAVMSPSLQHPVTCSRGGELTLPSRAGGTLILRDALDLGAAEQQRLLAWMAQDDSATQIISTCVSPVFPSVTRGDFLEPLYYSLNVMMIALGRPKLKGRADLKH
jgi:hypothetical protein